MTKTKLAQVLRATASVLNFSMYVCLDAAEMLDPRRQELWDKIMERAVVIRPGVKKEDLS